MYCLKEINCGLQILRYIIYIFDAIILIIIIKEKKKKEKKRDSIALLAYFVNFACTNKDGFSYTLCILHTITNRFRIVL